MEDPNISCNIFVCRYLFLEEGEEEEEDVVDRLFRLLVLVSVVVVATTPLPNSEAKASSTAHCLAGDRRDRLLFSIVVLLSPSPIVAAVSSPSPSSSPSSLFVGL